MKKKRIAIGILFFTMMFTGCSGKQEETGNNLEKNSQFHYNLKEAAAYTIDGDDILVSYDGNPVIERYNEKGEKTEELEIEGELHTNLTVNGECLFAVTYTESGMQITEYNMESRELTLHLLPEDMTSVLSMAVTEDEIYLIYWSDEHNEEEENVRYDENDSYYYMGEKAVSIPRDTYEILDMPIKNVIALYQCDENEIVYYAYDDIGGFYFVTYDPADEKFGEKTYNNVFGSTFGFAFDREENRVITARFRDQRLVLGYVDDDNAITEFGEQIVVMTGNDLKYQDGNCYVLDDITKDVIRINLESALVGNSELTFYQTTDFDEPYGCGYTIRTDTLENEEFALSVMAEDSQYDICRVSTDTQVASEIRDKGAFYALNDVPGVEEYLDACHPYIKEAATDESGAVWMLPIDLDIPLLLYNEENCRENGVEAEELTDFKQLVEAADHFYETPELREWYSLNGYQMRQAAVDKFNEGYIRRSGEVVYDTPVFEELCELFKEYRPGEKESLSTDMTQLSAMLGDEEGYYAHYLLKLAHFYEISGADELTYTKLRARALPDVGEEQLPSYGICTYLSVNPNSDNLEDTLEYISAYCGYMMGRTDTCLFQEKQMPYPDSQLSEDLHEIYKNGGISFFIPEEIFWDDYLDYQDGKLSFKELAEELNRKVSMYLNE